jgi:signal transduction histidine kinase
MARGGGGDESGTEKALRKSERLRAEAEAIGRIGSWEHDLVTGEIFQSEQQRRIFFGDDPTKGERLEDYVEAMHPDDRERVTSARQQLHADDSPSDIEYRVIWPDGSVHHVLGRAHVIRDEHGRPVRAVGTNVEVTDQRRAEEQLARHARQQGVVARLGLRALLGGDLQALLDETAALVVEALGVDLGAVLEATEGEGVLFFRAGAGPWKPGVVGRATVPLAFGSIGASALRAGAPFVVDDVRVETRFAPSQLLREHDVVSVATVPILGRSRPWGLLQASSRTKRVLTRDDVSFLASVANLLGTTMDRLRVEALLREKHELLQTLSRRLIEAQEAERRAVARELHDDLGQLLTAIKLDMQRQEQNPVENIALVDEAIARMRELARDLRPAVLDDLGLGPALRWYVTRETRRAGLELDLDVGSLAGRLPPAVETTCFRVVQEALTNVIRHAHALRVAVAAGAARGAVELTVRDDGAGFDVAEARKRAARGESQGLLGMQERVALASGELRVESAPGSGTTIRARIPCTSGDAP